MLGEREEVLGEQEEMEAVGPFLPIFFHSTLDRNTAYDKERNRQKFLCAVLG